MKNCLAAIHICAELSEGKLRDIRKKVKDADYLINNLQLQIKGTIAGTLETKDFKQYSIAKNIKEAIEQYPFKEGERELITLDIGSDFEYVGNPVLTSHMLFNKFNYVVFKDTAQGMSPKVMETLFEPFIGHKRDSSGLGLTFCKMIMKSYAGDITCVSKEDEYTEFTLHFPVTNPLHLK